jgi:hypothetical protein
MRAAVFGTVLTAACLLGCSKGKRAGSPADAVRLLEAATRDGNFEERLALTPKRDRDMVIKARNTFKRLKQASTAFDDALDARFGPDASHPRKQTHDLGAAFDTADDNARIELVSQEPIDDNTVHLKLKMTRTSDEKTGATKTNEVDCLALKEDDGWKLKMGTDANAESKDDLLITVLERQIGAYERGTTDIKSGQYTSRADALATLHSQLTGKP